MNNLAEMILHRIEEARSERTREYGREDTQKSGAKSSSPHGEADLGPSAALLLPRRTAGGTPSSERLASDPTPASQMFKLFRYGPLL